MRPEGAEERETLDRQPRARHRGCRRDHVFNAKRPGTRPSRRRVAASAASLLPPLPRASSGSRADTTGPSIVWGVSTNLSYSFPTARRELESHEHKKLRGATLYQNLQSHQSFPLNLYLLSVRSTPLMIYLANSTPRSALSVLRCARGGRGTQVVAHYSIQRPKSRHICEVIPRNEDCPRRNFRVTPLRSRI